MRIFTCFTALLFTLLLSAQGYVNPNYHWVEGYYRRDGTYVKGHYRTNPNHTNRDNYSTLGNTNPHTGKPGWIPPDNYPLTYSNNSTQRTYSGSYNNSNYSRSYRSSSNRIRNNRGVIHYTDGKDEFGITYDRPTNYSSGQTFYYYDEFMDEVRSETDGIPDGLLLHGRRTVTDEDGDLLAVMSYHSGRLHGVQLLYDESGEITMRSELQFGRTMSYETKDEEGEKVRFERQGEASEMTYFRGTEIAKVITDYPDGTSKVDVKALGEDELDISYHLKDGILEGPFAVYHPNGQEKRVGKFVLGMKEGLVRTYDEEGNLAKLENYRADLNHGPYIEYDQGQIWVKGQYEEGLRTDRWNYYFYDDQGGYVYQYITYQNDVLDGPFQRTTGDTIRIGNYSEGAFHGPMKVYRTADLAIFGKPARTVTEKELIAEGSYEQGQKVGRWHTYIYPRLLKSEGEYRAGKKIGKWHFYTRDEQNEDSTRLYAIETYQDDIKHGPFKFYKEGGMLAMEGNFRFGKEEGLMKLYHENGQWMETYYHEGLKSGSHKLYADSGQLLTEGTYSNDEPIDVWRTYHPGRVGVLQQETRYTTAGKSLRMYDTEAREEMSADYAGEKLKTMRIYEPRTGQLKEVYTDIEKRGNRIFYNFTQHLPQTTYHTAGFVEGTDLRVGEEQFDLFEWRFREGKLPLFTRQGPFQELDAGSGLARWTGQYYADRRTGKWKQFLRNQGVVRNILLLNEVFYTETFTRLGLGEEDMVSGKFHFTNLEGQMEEVKVKDGLRHGRTKVYTITGTLLKKLKYKRGKLVE